MSSRFLEAEPTELQTLARQLRPFIEALKPVYVSDHVASFEHERRQLPRLLEWDYAHGFAKARARVHAWQEELGVRVHLENFPSLFTTGLGQADFFSRLLPATGAGLLFDISNAVVARENCGAPVQEWFSSLREDQLHFHVAGYSSSGTTPAFLLDSHDCAPSAMSLQTVVDTLKATTHASRRTLVVERDANITREHWLADLQTVKACHA
jgi:uncharacterized protein (UPF0276 family)